MGAKMEGSIVNRNSTPWYREPWPWILMSGPFFVVVAALVSAWIAVKTSDGLVADDYYKQGLAVGQTLARSERAAEMGLAAKLRLHVDGATIHLAARQSSFVMPAALRITLSHPTRAGLDSEQILVRQGDLYVGKVRLPAAGHWLILIEDEGQTWRLMGSVVLPAAGEVVIGGLEAADIRN
jgi:hypothetical protein